MTLTLRIPRRLESPNFWNGRHWRVKHRISQEWEEFVRWGDKSASRMDIPVLTFGDEGVINHRVRVSIERQVPSARNFIRDDDNLRFAVKPLLDALKRQGYIKNDSRKWLEHPTPTQSVSVDGKDWTVITIEPAEALAAAVRREEGR